MIDTETWYCGDCGTSYLYFVAYCKNKGLDSAYLALYKEMPSRAEQYRTYPIYLSVARDLNIAPPRPDFKPWPSENAA